MCFNSRSDNRLPSLYYDGTQLSYTDTFKYLGMVSRPIVGGDESYDGAVKLVDSWEFLYVLFNKLDGQSYW